MNYYLVLNLGLALIWAALTGEFNPTNLVIGYAIGFAALLIVRKSLPPSNYFNKVYQVIAFSGYFLLILAIANLRVARDVLTRNFSMQPRVIAFPLEARTDLEITLLSNFITLTPGSLSMDVSSDKKVLYVHAMYAADENKAISEIRSMERRLLAVMR